MLGSIIAAKSMGATGAGGMIKMGNSVRKWGQAGVGGATLGMGARFGRSTIGAASSGLAKKLENNDWAANSFTGKLALKSLRGVGDSSFDARNTKIGKSVTDSIPGGLGSGIKGGYKTKTDVRRKAEMKYAQSLKGETLSYTPGGAIEMAPNPTTGVMEPVMIKRSERYGQKIQNRRAMLPGTAGGRQGRTILSSMFATTGGDRDAAKQLVDIPKYEREMKEAKTKLKDLKDERKLDPLLVSNQQIREQEDKIDEFKGKIKKIKDSLKDK